jgi:spore germination cell wall hydrolase CwlJ-like protein
MKKLLVLLILISTSSLAHHKNTKKTRYLIPPGSTQTGCMALNLYFEARNVKNDLDVAAIGYVVIKRVKNTKYPDDICHVVWQQRTHYRTGKWTAMYSWTLDGLSDEPVNAVAYRRCLKIARQVISRKIKDVSGGATHYHTKQVKPSWRKKLLHVASLGNHLFYK